jgi:hypothetical protein
VKTPPVPVPADVVTDAFTTPAACAAVVAVIVVLLSTEKEVTGVPPMVTAVAGPLEVMKPVPVMVTLVPPLTPPLPGQMLPLVRQIDATVGAGSP